jgi:GntR family transcriptional regulator/MocR family aminotransferase
LEPASAFPSSRALARHLGVTCRGAHADPERIVIYTGFTQAKNLIWRVLRARGATHIALEDPGQLESRADDGKPAPAWLFGTNSQLVDRARSMCSPTRRTRKSSPRS